MRLSPAPNRACDFHRTRLSVLAPLTRFGPFPCKAKALTYGKTPLKRFPTGVLVYLGRLESVAFLADLHPVKAITAWRSATTPPPSSVLHAGILASRCRVKQFESSPVPRGRVRATRSLPALRRVSGGRTLTEVETVRHTYTITVWSSVSAAFTCWDLRRFKRRFLSSA